MKTLEINKNSSVKFSIPSCACPCSSPCPAYKAETVNLEKNLKNIYKKA